MTQPMMSILEQEAQALGVPLTPAQIAAFAVYARELAAWNERANLTAISDAEEVQVKHFLDSLTCLQALPAGAGLRLVDVGSGAGFPGLPLKIVRADISLCLMESVGKKAVVSASHGGAASPGRSDVLEGPRRGLGRMRRH